MITGRFRPDNESKAAVCPSPGAGNTGGMGNFSLTVVRTGKEKKMPEAREILDVYLGSDEEEQFDLWFSNRELRTQFDAVDHLSWKREIRTAFKGKNTRSKGSQKFLGRMARCHPRPAQI